MQTPSGTGSVGIIPWDGEIIPSSDALPRLRRDTGADGVDSSEKEKSVQRTVLILAVAAAALVLASGVALAAVVNATGGDDRLVGTGGADTIRGFGGDDTVRVLDGKDEVSGGEGDDALHGGSYAAKMFGGNGRDEIYGGRGNDFISSVGDDCSRDFVDCGPGTDTANQTPDSGVGDTFRDCEETVG